MYLMKTKKHIEQNDLAELQLKQDRHAERQRVDAAEISSRVDTVEHSQVEFKPDELPDGACFRPKSVLNGAEDGQTAVRAAEYIGSFSVSGTDQQSRAEFVQTQLENMREVDKSKKVLLVISLSGIKVCSSSGESVYMAHALKRISYAASDPDHCQFAFLAREPKGHINIQFCHAFIVKSPEEAEELNTIVGNAFKMAYAQQKVIQPTFNELIEKQLVEQKVKFAEYQDQCNRTLQARLHEIATPMALQRMEMRRQSSSDDLPVSPTSSEREMSTTRNKIWYSLTRYPQQAKHAVERVQHLSPTRQQGDPTTSPRRSDSPTFSSRNNSSSNAHQRVHVRKSDPSFSAVKRNSTPVHLSPSKTNSSSSPSSSSSTSSPKRNSSPQLSSMQSLNVVTIRESLENKNTNNNNSNRFKGSPVTALKDEIDRRFFSNGGLGTIDSGLGFSDEIDSFPRPQLIKYEEKTAVASKMLHRPLPALPKEGDSLLDHRASPRVRNWTSLDDDVIPHHSRSTLQSRHSRDSPKRRPQRPQSEIFETKISANMVDQPGMYIYGGGVGGKHQSQFQPVNMAQQKQRHEFNLAPIKQQSPRANQNQAGYDNMNNMENGKASPLLHFQNDDPSNQEGRNQGDGHEESSPSKSRPGLESLMGLDRSHIEDETLRHSSWYQAGIPRDVALEILQQEDIGSFIVRDSTTHPGCYALSVRVPKFENPTGISHYLILRTQRGVKLKGLEKEWSSLIALVTHHTVMPEMLPCTLRLPRDTKNPSFKDSDKDEKEEDPDYQRLADFSSMMAALKM